jgi:hypothetical protein
MSDPGFRHEGAERRSWILTKLRSLGFLSIADLARELGVSPMTVRRDLHTLEREARPGGGQGRRVRDLRAFPWMRRILWIGCGLATVCKRRASPR